MTKRPKIDKPSAQDLLVPARETRQTVENFQPMVTYVPRKGRGYIAILEGDGALEDMVGGVLADMRAQLGPAEWIAVTTDAYVQHTATPVALERGTLAKRFAEGDLGVSEQMVVLLKCRNEPAEMAVQSYRYTPVEGWEWDEPEVVTDQHGGVVDVIEYYT